MPSQQELFEARYSQIAKTDRVGWSDEYKSTIGRYQNLLNLANQQSGKVLELGCGRGNISLALAQQGFEVTGVDFSPTAIDWARNFATETGQTADFEVADLGQPWPFGHDSFDVVIDANCLHFLHGDDRVRYLAEARRVTKRGGALLLSTIVNEPDEKDWEFLLYDPHTRTSRQNGITMNYYTTVPELVYALSLAGFEVSHSEMTNIDHELIWLVAKGT
jgi:2-polyprenyl-3-methyl-5-hydroxy-6-metoxy-1,4-benzoquinol methylase